MFLFKKFLILICVVCMVFSCQKHAQKTKELRISFNMDPPTLDPRKSGDYISSATLFMLFRGLMHSTDTGIEPSLAKSYDVSNDQKTYTFHLREAKWSDGHDITAYDFEKSWKKIIDPDFPALCKTLFYPIKNAEKASKNEIGIEEVGIKALDNKTLVVELENPTPYFLSLTSFCIFFPIPSHLDEEYLNYTNGKKFVSSGPFILKKWDRNNKILVEKNPYFYNKDKIQLDGIDISIVSDENTILQMYENDELDWLGSFLAPLSVDALTTAVQRDDIHLTPIGGCSFCAFNVDHPQLKNVNIRKALSLAINRKEIVDNITQLNEVVATRIISPVLINNQNKSILQDNDALLAKKYLDQGLLELGIDKKDLDLTLSYGSISVHKKEAETLQNQWKKALGIDVKILQFEEKALRGKLHSHDIQIGLAFLLVQYKDPMNIFERFKYKTNPKNFANWENEEFKNLLELSMSTADQKNRFEILEKAEKLFLEEMPISPLYHYNYASICKKNIKGVYIGGAGDLHFDNTNIER